MVTNWEAVIRQARESHTKQAWESLFEAHGDAIASNANSKPVADLFKILKNDPQCLQYDPSIFGRLIQGCLASWNLELGKEIAEFAKPLPSAVVAIPSAQLYLESGTPSMSREIAQRALRLSGLSQSERLSLEMLVASSYAEEGKRQKTIKVLNQIRSSLDDPGMKDKERADMLTSIGRMQFLLGRYLQAAEVFYEASKIYQRVRDWEGAARTIFNSGACFLNGGARRREEAFALIEECRQLAEAHELAGPLSHCEAAYGMEAYQHGDFAGAREHFRRALEYLPISDKSYRRLHILSMLAFTYLVMGRYHLARKFGQQTLALAAMDESERFRTRYITLQAELLWEDGLIDESQKMLREASEPLGTQGVHILEELATLSRLNLQSALLDAKTPTYRCEIDESLSKNHHTWLDDIYASGQLLMNAGDFVAATRNFQDCLDQGRAETDRYHEALGLLGLIQTRLAQRQPETIDHIFREFEVLVARLGETPLKAQVMFIHAARAYQCGDFVEAQRILRQTLKGVRQSFADKFVLSSWLSTLEGKSPRLSSEWQMGMVARFTRTFFAPTLEAVDDRNFRVSKHYIVSLERHPSLAELLHYLMFKGNFSATTAEIQTSVWKQSLQSQGWQQKIRNTIMRLRDFFPYSVAPIIVHTDQISLFKEAISIHPPRRADLTTDEEILHLLSDGPASSLDIADRLNISLATSKRIIKKLLDSGAIEAIRSGRNVSYRISAGQEISP